MLNIFLLSYYLCKFLVYLVPFVSASLPSKISGPEILLDVRRVGFLFVAAGNSSVPRSKIVYLDGDSTGWLKKKMRWEVRVIESVEYILKGWKLEMDMMEENRAANYVLEEILLCPETSQCLKMCTTIVSPQFSKGKLLFLDGSSTIRDIYNQIPNSVKGNLVNQEEFKKVIERENR